MQHLGLKFWNQDRHKWNQTDVPEQWMEFVFPSAGQAEKEEELGVAVLDFLHFCTPRTE